MLIKYPQKTEEMPRSRVSSRFCLNLALGDIYALSIISALNSHLCSSALRARSILIRAHHFHMAFLSGRTQRVQQAQRE